MGRKKKKALKPWCWYCGRDFEDEKILIQHQRAKHFKCPVCHKKLYTGPGLAIHCMQVHRETIKEIPNALPNRTNPEVEIYGTEGIPEEDAKARAARKGDIDEPDAKKAKPDQQITPQAGLTPSAAPTVTAAAPGFWRPGVPGFPQPNRPPLGMPMPPVPFGAPPMQARFPFPNMPPPNPNIPPPVRAPAATNANNSTPPNRPLFPSASQVSSSTTISSGPVGADFKPISNSKTFEAKPVMNENKAPSEVASTTVPTKVPTVVTSLGATTKLVHPEEDISLEERRAAKYKLKMGQSSQLSTSSMHAAVPPFSYGAPPQAANMPPTARVPTFPKF